MPLSEQDVKEAQTDRVVRAPVRAKIVLPMQFVPNLIATLQEHARAVAEGPASKSDDTPSGDPVH